MKREIKIKLGKMLETAPRVLLLIVGVNIVMLGLLGFSYLIVSALF